ncbi:HNH endonuclease [Anaerovibrio sp. JC8]|uniref:HNH endonuclease n=1 Tax=Anaerovibrio sp. JC8 TaxID=1240085 RepID=UPI000A0F8FE8
MLKACSYCGRIHRAGEACPNKPQRTYKKNNSQESQFRNTGRWKRAREEIKKRDKYLCRLCLANGHITTNNLEVHHIIKIRQDSTQALEPSNLITLCTACHNLVENEPKYIETLQELTQQPVNIPPTG